MLNLSGIKKTYNRGDVTRMCLFDGFDLSVKDGEFVSIVGSNGSGKTSLLNIICGDISPSPTSRVWEYPMTHRYPTRTRSTAGPILPRARFRTVGALT